MLAAAELAYDHTPSVSKESGERFQWLQQHTDKDISIVSEKNATHGLFFRPHKLGAYTALFPELHLLPQSVHSALSNPVGATVAEGKKADIVIDTDGFLHATGQLHADDNIFARAKRGALFETGTYDAMAITQNEVEYTERSGLFGLDHDTVRYRLTEWHQIKRAREPMLVTTTRGDFVIVIPNNEEASHFEEMVSDINTNEKRKDRVKKVGSTVEFKGTVTDIAGDVKLIGPDAEVILSPLEIATVVPCPQIASANRISTTLPVFLRTVLKAKGVEADVRVFKNNGSQIKALNDVVIKASDRIEFNTETRKFTLAEGVTTHASMFSTSTSYHRIDDVTFSAPTTEAGGNIHFKTDTANLTGQFSADNDIILNAQIAELKSVLAYGTEEFHSKAYSWISSSSYDRFATFSRISPTIFQSHGDFIADLTDIYFEHSIQKSCHNERITASRIDSSPLEVHETVTESRSSSGFDFFLPLAVYAPVCDGRISDALDAFWQQSSLLTATHSLLNSRRGADLAANGISLALSAYSTLNTLLSKGIGGGLSLFGIGNFGFHSSQINSNMKHDFTVASTVEASGSITWEARSGDIRIAHRIAKAGENQRYTASGNILVEPGHDTVSMASSSSSSGMSFNVFTKDVGLNFSHGETSAVSTDYLASGFHSVGDNVFSAGNGIHIIVPQISGTRNTFDALVVNLENRANIHESHSSSSGVGLSTNLAESAGLMASMNLGTSGFRDTYLNEEYIRGAVDFAHSQVRNQGCLVMDITNAGASYRYVPMEEVHESSSFAIGLSGLDLSSPDAFAYSLGRGLASAAASAGVGMLASEAG
ncbi:MAG: hemagglutinin repeat-containing protein, partial [Alphaproteobacteria bacterium]|nr:hemagglutinin repeat-containing protein [Alphaproteobacteria bacterium]